METNIKTLTSILVIISVVAVVAFSTSFNPANAKISGNETNLTCGDVDASNTVDIDDVVYLIDYIFSGGPEPMCDPILSCGDVDSSYNIDVDDVVYLNSYIFGNGTAPMCPEFNTSYV